MTTPSLFSPTVTIRIMVQNDIYEIKIGGTFNYHNLVAEILAKLVPIYATIEVESN